MSYIPLGVAGLGGLAVGLGRREQRPFLVFFAILTWLASAAVVHYITGENTIDPPSSTSKDAGAP